MTEKSFSMIADYDGLALSGILVEPLGEKKGIVQIAHGMAERKERYLPFMRYLAKNGYVAVCHDHRGHGQSMQQPKDQGWFGDYSGRAVVEDTLLVNRYIKREYPNLPLILFGHSMGSLIARLAIAQNDGICDKLIVCGSPSKNGAVGMAIFVEKCIRLFRGGRHRSKTLKRLALGPYSKPFQGEGSGAWLSKNRDNVEAYIADPNCGFNFTCNGYENLFKLLKRTYQRKEYTVTNPSLPIHFVAGGDDPVIGNELKWFQSVEFMRSLGYTDVSGKLYEGYRHEILNEDCREEVFADLLAFLER